MSSLIGKLYEDKLDDVNSKALWLTTHHEYQEELESIRTKLKANQVADGKYIGYGVQVLELPEPCIHDILSKIPSKSEVAGFRTFEQPFDGRRTDGRLPITL